MEGRGWLEEGRVRHERRPLPRRPSNVKIGEAKGDSGLGWAGGPYPPPRHSAGATQPGTASCSLRFRPLLTGERREGFSRARPLPFRRTVSLPAQPRPGGGALGDRCQCRKSSPALYSPQPPSLSQQSGEIYNLILVQLASYFGNCSDRQELRRLSLLMMWVLGPGASLSQPLLVFLSSLLLMVLSHFTQKCTLFSSFPI